MVINQEYFTVELGSNITLGLPLDEMAVVTQFETSDICPVPGVADFWYGVAKFKGSLLWILDSDRFFNFNLHQNKAARQVTTIIIKSQQLESEKKVALVTQKLNGIVTVEPSCCQPLADDAPLQLRQCCSSLAQIEDKAIYLIDTTDLIQKLHQQSMLVSA